MKPTFPGFDPDQIREYFKFGEEFNKAFNEFATLDPKAVDPARIYEVQRSNMEALVDANRKAAEAYEDLYRKQIDTLRAAAERIQNQFEELRSDPESAMSPQRQAELMKEALEETARQLSELAQSAAKVNAGALEGIGRQIAANAVALADTAKR